MPSLSVIAAVPPERAWRMIAEPGRWHEWSPHVAGAEGLGDPEVREGASGSIRLRGGVPVPATITRVDPGRSWQWKIGPMVMNHRVEPDRDGSRITIDLDAPGPLGLGVGLTYGPVVRLILANLRRVAEREVG